MSVQPELNVEQGLSIQALVSTQIRSDVGVGIFEAENPGKQTVHSVHVSKEPPVDQEPISQLIQDDDDEDPTTLDQVPALHRTQWDKDVAPKEEDHEPATHDGQ